MNYAVVSAGRRWREGRIRLDGYAFAGWQTARRAVGTGVKLETLLARTRWIAAFDTTTEDVARVGGRSRTARLAAQWRWAP